MTDQYVGVGNIIHVTAVTGGVTEGTVYRGTNSCGVYLDSATGGAQVAVGVEGVFTLVKPTALNVGVLEQLYATTTPALTSTTGATNLPVGISTAAAATGITAVNVKLATFGG